jgi:hypothetical protein
MELEVFKRSMSSQCSSQVDLFKGLLQNDHSVVNLAAVAPAPADGDSLPGTVADINSGRMVNLPP